MSENTNITPVAYSDLSPIDTISIGGNHPFITEEVRLSVNVAPTIFDLIDGQLVLPAAGQPYKIVRAGNVWTSFVLDPNVNLRIV